MAASLVVFTAAVVGFLQYRQNTANTVARETERLEFSLQKSLVYLSDIVDDTAREALFLADTPPIRGMMRAHENRGIDPLDDSTESAWKNRLALTFHSMAESDPKLLQIRLIAANGKELVRVERKGSSLVRIPQNRLQDKSQSDYVIETMKAKAGSVHLFDIDLNREQGKIQFPTVAVWRRTTPIVFKNGEVFGLIVLNINMNYVFERMTDLFEPGQTLYLTNEAGDYLIHPDRSKAFGFDLGERHLIQTDFMAFAPFLAGKQSRDTFLDVVGADGKYLAHLTKLHYDRNNPERFFFAALATPMARLFSQSSAVGTRIIVATGALAALGALIAFFLSCYIVRPLRRLRSASRRLIEGTPVESLSIPIERRDEVGELARSFLRMASTLQEKQARMEAVLKTATNPIITISERGTIQDSNDATTKLLGYSRDEMIGSNVSMLMNDHDRARHDDYLAAYQRGGPARIIGIGREVEALRNDGTSVPINLSISEVNLKGKTLYTGIITDLTELKKVDKMKNEFVSTVSHELRTPLTSIKGSLGLLRASLLGELPDQVKSMIEIAYNNSDRLVRLINDILDIEKIEAGKLSFVFQKIDVKPFLERAVEANRTFATELGVTLELAPLDEDLLIDGDPDRLEQVLTNLLANAAKFSPVGTTVHIATRIDGDMLRISVRDEGPGIPEEFQDKIFGKFAQADASSTKDQGGTGLGLAITRAIVKQHGGEIDFTTAKDAGTTFFVDLPILQAASAASSSDEAGPKRRVLVCEDDPDMATLLRLVINDMGYEVDLCTSAATAKDRLAGGSYAAMTLDLSLPDIDGVSLIRDLREDPNTRDLPILVVSGRTAAGQEALDGSAFQVVDWLEKPIDVEKLRSGVQRATKAAGARATRILCIEDNTDHLAILSSLCGKGVVIDSAATCKEARAALEGADYDLVVLDLVLPDGNGESLLPLIHANGAQPPQVLVFSMKEIPESLVTKVDAAIVKSQTSNEALRRQIRSLLGSDETERRFDLSDPEAKIALA